MGAYNAPGGIPDAPTLIGPVTVIGDINQTGSFNTTGPGFISAEVVNGGTVRGQVTLESETGSTNGFFGADPVARPTGVAVTAAAIHAALVALGLITA